MIGYFVRRNMIRSWAAVRKEDEARLAGQTLAPGVAADANLAYVDDGDPMHLLDVYYPSGATRLLPTIVDIHGGGWMHGDKDLHKHYGYSLAAQGFAVVNVSYRLLPRTDLRGQVQDLSAVLHWLERHGAEHHCDLSRLYLCGDSAGGHLAGLTAACSSVLSSRRLTASGPPDCGSRRSGSATACASCRISGASAKR